ncbi:MAG: DUF4397 domain-containing protein [Flavobacteriales bacterium]|nr:DUF4397 domain-containing protein [Flavobacteriales bacterium]
MIRLGHTLPLLTACLLVHATSTFAQTAQVQLIHNSADAAASIVDVYINGELDQDDMAFRTATAFLNVPAGPGLEIGLAPSNSTGSDDVIASFELSLSEGEQYVAVVNGIISAAGYEPAPELSLALFSPARESSLSSGTTDILMFNGSTDAPGFSMEEVAVPVGSLFGSLPYGEFVDYLSMPSANLSLELTMEGVGTYSYAAPLGPLGLQDRAVVVVASGFVDPMMNQNGPGFGLWLAEPGGGDLIELVGQEVLPTRVQWINNSADNALSVIDIYLDGSLLINDLAFRTATAFMDIDPDNDNIVAIAPGNSTNVFDAFEEFDLGEGAGRSNVAVINGIVTSVGYEPFVPLSVDVRSSAREMGPDNETVSLLFHHGSTDADDPIDINDQSGGQGTLADELAYGGFSLYADVPANDFILEVVDGGGEPIEEYDALAATDHWEGLGVTVLASGFEDPSANSGGPRFGLWAAFPEGGSLVELPVHVNVGVAEEAASIEVKAWPNPASDEVFVSLGNEVNDQLAAAITDLTGRKVMDIPAVDLVNGRLRIPLTTMTNGSYLLQVAGDESTYTVPFQVAR